MRKCRTNVKDFSSAAYPSIGVDETYSLTVDADQNEANIQANTVWGALRGLETFSQLVTFDFDAEKYEIKNSSVAIFDFPRFPHRGLMIDSARHYETLEAIRGIIDSLPYAKINTLHWHMSDTQSFPFQSFAYPKLWEASWSPEERYTQADVSAIVEYARMRGVRTYVEFDVPGHAGSWCKGYPEICPSPTCTQPLNVANNKTFDVIDGLLEESSGKNGLFKDEFVHLGGDEVDTSCWTKSSSIRRWLSQRNMTADDGYAYFAKRAADIAISKGRRPVQWSEVYDHFKTELDKRTVVHIWKSNTNVTEVVANGYDVLRNVGYFQNSWYLDNLNVNWTAVYANDPCDGVPTDALCAKILGGNGEMWGETVDASDIEETVWPRLAAIAEKLWSPRASTKEVTATTTSRIENFRCLLNGRGVRAAPVNNANAREAPPGPGPCTQTEENEDGHEIEASNSRSVITLYRNGFVVDGGPFRPNEGSANKRFLRDLSRGVCPGELEEGGEPRVVEIKDRHTEDFRKPSYVAFGGDGHTLAAPSNATALAPGSDKDDDDLTGKPIQIRDGEPTVRVQIQLHDRRREIVVCHKSTTVRELWRHVVSLTPGIKFVLLQGYPPKPIDGAKFDVSIGDAGLAGARVMQRKT
eukprot:g220.t1